jgi:hypothetical protein
MTAAVNATIAFGINPREDLRPIPFSELNSNERVVQSFHTLWRIRWHHFTGMESHMQLYPQAEFISSHLLWKVASGA